LQTQDVNQRDVTCFNTVTSQAKIPEAKKMIAKFRSELMHFLEVDKGDTVYQVNIQMFNLLD